VQIDGDVVGRVVAALVLGAAVGLEREMDDQPAGLRTHITVSVGAALFGVISTLGFLEFDRVRADTNVQIDVTRVASEVVVGIGFIGAGMIFRQGTSVRNITTAASLWVTSAIGLAAGVGDIGTAAFTTVVLLGTLVLLRPVRRFVRGHLARHTRTLKIVLADGVPPTAVIDALHALHGVDTARVSIEKQNRAYVLVADVRAERHIDLDDRIATITTRDDVISLADD
jgi:putative Mg2+ transporter-C (MgtC) family protein